MAQHVRDWWTADLDCGCVVSLDLERQYAGDELPSGGRITRPCKLHGALSSLGLRFDEEGDDE